LAHPFEPITVTIHDPVKTSYPLAVVGSDRRYPLFDTRYRTDERLFELYRDELDGKFALADTKNVNQVVTSFAEYATRDYDREFVRENVDLAIQMTAMVTPDLDPQKLIPEFVIGFMQGEKAAGYKCNGTKYKFHSTYYREMIETLRNPVNLLQVVPLYTVISKDEVRDVTKACRDLAFPPCWFTDLGAMYEKDFFLCTLEKYAEGPIKLGIPLPQCWKDIILGLRRHRNRKFISRYFEWDAKKFDRSHPIEITLSWPKLMALKKAIDELFEHDPILQYLNFWSCIRLVILPDGRIVLVLAGIYSGDISTSNKNSYFHIIRLALCWLRIFDSVDGFVHFMRISGICLFGDDAVCAAHCPRHLYFLSKIQSAWEALFGAELKVHSSEDISGVSFLGKRSLGNDDVTMYLPVTADLDRQIASLVLKGKRNADPVQTLSKLTAHRQLLCGFSIHCDSASDEITQRNQRGERDLALLDIAIKEHVEKYDATNNHDEAWNQLRLMAYEMRPQELFGLLLTGSDMVFAE